MPINRNIVQEESVLRRVNQAIERGSWPGEDGNVVRMRCECGRFDCNKFLRIRVRDYQQMRSNPRRFVLCEGHETPDIEKVVRRHADYVIVEKTGRAGSAADESAQHDVT